MFCARFQITSNICMYTTYSKTLVIFHDQFRKIKFFPFNILILILNWYNLNYYNFYNITFKLL